MIVVRHSYISARRQPRIGGKPPGVVAMGKALAHVKYIQHRPGEDREKGGREFFGEGDDELSARRLRKAVKEMANAKVVVHKVTLAPEINPADKKAFTREVMKELGSEKGLDLNWFAVEHNNTDHHHIHVVILGKDKNGRDVHIDKRDYDKIKEYGDRHLERVHPLEMERARDDREKKEHDRLQARKVERDMRKIQGLELPWMHKQIIREQLEPYSKWKEQQLAKERAKSDGKDKAPAEEKPYFQDTIEAAGKEWSKRNTLGELKELNKHLWDNYDERIDVQEYKKLVAWIKEKERFGEKNRDEGAKEKGQDEAKKPAKEKDHFVYEGNKYSKLSFYDELASLNSRVHDKDAPRMPIENYQQMRTWLEDADRSRWSGVLEKQMEASKKQFGKEGAAKTMPDNFRMVNPLQDAVMRNPVVGMFMAGASVANELVKWIPLTDQRDRLKEGRDALEAAKLDKHQEHNQPGRPEERKAQDRETIEKLDKAIDENQATRDKSKDDKKKKQNDRPSEDDPFAFDPWGRW